MLILTIFFLFFQLDVNFGSDILTEIDFDVLTRNLIENFRVDPFLNGESASRELSQTSKEFIDKHVERYRQLVLTSKEKEFSRSKRSLYEREKEAESRDYNTDLNPYGNVSTFPSSDTVFFHQNLQWYAATITKKPNGKDFNLLRIIKYSDNKFNTIIEAGIENGVRLSTFPLENSTLLVVAENSTKLNHTKIYELNFEEEFDIIEKVNGTGYHDVNIWEDNGNVFMSLVGFMANSPVSSSSRLYKWRGRHFDVLQNILDTGAARITPFQIGDEGFVAVARNKASGDSESHVYSDILKYNVATEKYELFQKILTHACEDIKYFEIDAEVAAGGDKQGFLIVANFYEKDSQGKINYQTSSIIYRFVDEYFIPFQSIVLKGVRQWQPITNKDRDVLLVALTMDGLTSFVYDGWHFIESNINFGGDLKSPDVQDIKELHSYQIDNKNILVVIRKNPSKNDHLLFEISFSTKNKIKQIHNELLNWCQNTTKEFSIMDEDILERNRRGDIEELESESQTEASDSEKLISKINKYNSKLFETANKLKNSLQSSEHHIIDRDLKANLIHINSTGRLQSVLTDKINNKDVNNVLNNALNINDGFQIDSVLEIDFLRTEEDLEPKTLNGHPADSIVYKNDYNELKNVKILGNAIFKDDVTIGSINDGIKIGEDSILLKNRDQNLGDLRVRKVRANNVQVKAVNGRPITTEAIIGGPKNNGKEKVRNVKTLKTKNLIVGGFLNDVDVPTLEKYALRKSGKQDITAETYYFDRVESELLDTDRLSGVKIPEELILTNTGTYVIPKSLLFAKPLAVQNLTVLQHLDSISVSRDGSLDLLLKNHNFQQHVTGTKTLKNLELLNPINVRGKLKGKAFENLDPLKKIESDLIIDHDVVIGGDVLVEDFLKSLDITTEDSHNSKEVTKEEDINLKVKVTINDVTESLETKPKKTEKPVEIVSKKDELQSVSRVVEHGVKLTDENVNIPITFLDHLGIDDIKVDTINGVDVDSWVVSGAKHTQVISGWKTFNGDLEITGDTNIFRINNIDTEEFESNILLTDGDQIITGKHEVDSVVVLGSLKTNNTKFGTQPWKNVITTTGDQTIDATITVSELSSNFTSATNLEIDGKINGINFTKMVEDAVVIDVPQKLFGTKNFTDLNIEHLTFKNNFDVKKKLQEIKKNNLILEDFGGIDTITANKVYFGKKLNGFHKTEFEIVKNDKKLIVEGDHEFEEITVFGNVFIETNQINHIDLDDIEENSIKIDEPHIFKNVEFGNIYVDTISHKGQIENLDLDNIFENGKEGSQNILDKIDFRGGLSVTGTVNINGRLNGVKVSELCDLTSESKTDRKMVIEGNVHFVKGPHIANFNGMSEKELNENLWFTDKPAKLQGNAIFLGNVTMREDMTLHGLLNGINVDYLSSNYLSKTKDQKIVASLTFPNTTVFLKDVTTSHMHVGNLINDIDLNDFLKNVLMHRTQLFEDVVYFEEVTVENLEGNYLVNKLNLDSEVMRYDRANFITGPKSFGGLHVDVLRTDREGATVQEVDVGRWLEGAVSAEGNYKIGGRKKFVHMVVEESTNLIGHFNDIKINSGNIMLKNVAQNITGIKTFAPKYPDELKFKSMKIKGLLNGDDFIDVVNNQANIKEDNDFEGKLQFSNKMTAQNVNFRKEYDGININQLLKNISTIGTLGSIKEKYHNLMNMVNDVEKSLKDQAFFLNYFKPVPPTFDDGEIFSLNCGANNNKVISFKKENDSNIRTFLDWDKKQEVFNQCCVEDLGPYPNYINKINLDGMDVVYIEHRDKSKTEDNTHKGQLLSCKNTTTQLFRSFLTKGTLFLKSFEIKSKNLQCLLFIDFSFDINILCSGQDKKFFLQQTIKNNNPVMASILLIEDHPYLATIHQEVLNKTVIWKLNNHNQFEVYTTYREGDPISVSTVSTGNGIFLAVAYKHLPNTKDFGKIIIRRFDKSSQTFTMFQNIKIETPTQILFAELPSKEIALYVTTQIPAEHFIAYLYEGVFGFVKKIGSSTLRAVTDIKEVTLKNEHFVVVKHDDDMTVLQAVFKGNKYDIED